MTPRFTTTDGEGGGGLFTLEPGEWHWKVVPEVEFGAGNYEKTEDCTSSKGNEQIKLALLVGDKERQVKIIDYLTFTGKAAWRISTFLKSAAVYPGHGVTGNLTAGMCIGLSGLCETENEPKLNSSYEKTVIRSWLPAAEQHPERLPELTKEPIEGSEPFTDEVPF